MSSVKKNYLYNVAYQMLLIIIPLISAPYISRVLGAERIGIQTYTYSIATQFALFTKMGIDNHGIRTISGLRDDKIRMSEEFWNIYSLQRMFAIFVTIAYFVYLIFISEEFFYIKLIQSSIVISSFFDISWFFFGIEQFKITVTRNSVARLVTLVLIFVFVKNQNDLWKYSLIIASSSLINHLILQAFLPRFVNKQTKINLSEIKKHLKPVLILFIPVLAVHLYITMDKIMLGMMSNMREVGFYNNAEKINNMPMGFIVAFGTVMMPRVSYLVEKGKDDLIRENIKKSMRFNMFLSSAMAFGIAAVGPYFAPVYFGKGFESVGLLAALLTPTVIFKSWANVLRKQYLIPHQRDRDFILSVVLGAIVNLSANLILIPKLNAVGAVFGTVLAELAVALYQTIAVRNDLEIGEYMKDGFKYLVFGGIMYLVLHIVSRSLAVGNEILFVIILIGIGAFIYLTLSFLFIKNKQKFIKNISKIFRKRKEKI